MTIKNFYVFMSCILLTSCTSGCDKEIPYASVYISNMYTVDPVKDILFSGDTLTFTVNIPRKIDRFAYIREIDTIYPYFKFNSITHDLKNKEVYIRYIDINGKINSKIFFIEKEDTYLCEFRITLNLDSLSLVSFKKDLISISPHIIIHNNYIKPNIDFNIEIFSTFKHKINPVVLAFS